MKITFLLDLCRPIDRVYVHSHPLSHLLRRQALVGPVPNDSPRAHSWQRHLPDRLPFLQDRLLRLLRYRHLDVSCHQQDICAVNDVRNNKSVWDFLVSIQAEFYFEIK